jgi:hypothetical protein
VHIYKKYNKTNCSHFIPSHAMSSLCFMYSWLIRYNFKIRFRHTLWTSEIQFPSTLLNIKDF